MRLLGIAALALSVSTAAAVAGDGAGTPITYHVPGVTVVIHKRDRLLKMNPYPQMTELHHPLTMQCVASQCLISVTSDILLGNYITETLCTYVDGVPMKPTCSPGGQGEVISSLQGQLISQGTHTFTTEVESASTTGGSVCPCSIRYTLYDSGN